MSMLTQDTMGASYTNDSGNSQAQMSMSTSDGTVQVPDINALLSLTSEELRAASEDLRSQA